MVLTVLSAEGKNTILRVSVRSTIEQRGSKTPGKRGNNSIGNVGFLKKYVWGYIGLDIRIRQEIGYLIFLNYQ